MAYEIRSSPFDRQPTQIAPGARLHPNDQRLLGQVEQVAFVFLVGGLHRLFEDRARDQVGGLDEVARHCPRVDARVFQVEIEVILLDGLVPEVLVAVGDGANGSRPLADSLQVPECLVIHVQALGIWFYAHAQGFVPEQIQDFLLL